MNNVITLSIDNRHDNFVACISTFRVECTAEHVRRLCIVDSKPVVYDRLTIDTKDVDGVAHTVYDSEEEIVDGVPHTLYKKGDDVWEDEWIQHARCH